MLRGRVMGRQCGISADEIGCCGDFPNMTSGWLRGPFIGGGTPSQGDSVMSVDINSLFAEHEADRYSLHTRYLNEQMVRVLKTIGYNVGFVRGKGQYLWDGEGARYLDLLSGWGVFAIGRNHPSVHKALRQVLDSEFPNLVQMDVSPL